MKVKTAIAVCTFALSIALQAQAGPPSGFDECLARHKSDLKVRVSQGVMRAMVLKAGTYEDANLKHDAPKAKGDVTARVLIDREGNVECAEPTAADSPMLIPGALEAIRATKFKPYNLNRNPVFVETQLVVRVSKGNFQLTW